MVLISEFVGPPNSQLNTDPLKCPHYVGGGGERNRGNTNQMPHVGKQVDFIPLKDLVIYIPIQPFWICTLRLTE